MTRRAIQTANTPKGSRLRHEALLVRMGVRDRHLLAVARHPEIVPHQHDHRRAEHARIEQFLARAFEGIGDRLREQRDHAGAQHPQADAESDPGASIGHTAGRREHDADDQAGFDGFPENDDECAKHAAIPRSRRLWRCPHGTRR